MDSNGIFALGKLTLAIGRVSVGFAGAVLDAYRRLFPGSDTASEERRSIQDADLVGDYNSRTQRFDSGTDPAGWYEDER